MSRINSEYTCDMDDLNTVTKENIVTGVCRFLTEIKKLNGKEYPGKTLYDLVICLQFHLKSNGISWKLLSHDDFKDIKFTLDNLMKECCAQRIGITVCKSEVLTHFHEEVFWSMGLLGVKDHCTLLNSVIYMLGKGFALRVGEEHRMLKAPPFSKQLTFMHDEQGVVFVRYSEESGVKTNEGGLKHRKGEPKTVDMYAITDLDRCPVRLLLTYLSKLPKDCKCHALYMQPHHKFTPESWYLDRPVGAKRLCETIKDICTEAGFPGYFTNHSLRSTSVTKLYRGHFDEQLIQEVTGHRFLAIRSYKRTSDVQRKEASNCLFSN